MGQDGSMRRAWVEFWAEEWIGEVGYQPSVQRPHRPIPGKGFPRICVEYDDVVLRFTSADEMRYVADVLATPLVDPMTSHERWYRHLPASVKGKHGRGRFASILRNVADAYEAQVPRMAATPSPIPRSGDRGEAPSGSMELDL